MFVSPRSVSGRSHPARDAVTALSADLARGSDRVRWIAPRAIAEAPVNAVPGVRMVDVVSDAPAFRLVQDRLTDLPTERALSSEIRTGPPDLLHVHGFGGAVSYLLPWLADRLGVPALVVVDPLRESLCHRGSLIDHTGQACRIWNDERRCAACCRVASPGGLGRGAAFLAGLLAPLGAIAPFPTHDDFANRMDMIVQGLGSARLVCVADGMAADALEGLGVPRRVLHVGIPRPTAVEWAPLHATLCGPARAEAI